MSRVIKDFDVYCFHQSTFLFIPNFFRTAFYKPVGLEKKKKFYKPVGRIYETDIWCCFFTKKTTLHFISSNYHFFCHLIPKSWKTTTTCKKLKKCPKYLLEKGTETRLNQKDNNWTYVVFSSPWKNTMILRLLSNSPFQTLDYFLVQYKGVWRRLLQGKRLSNPNWHQRVFTQF